MSVARDLATFYTRLGPSDLPEVAMKHAAMLVASTLSSAALGYAIPSSTIIRRLTRERGGTPEATLWFSGRPKLPIADAARCNGLTADAAASDDSDLRFIMHVGTPLVATALAFAEREGSRGADILAAIVVGYEAAGRMNDAIPGYRSRNFHGSTLAIFGSVIAAGRLLRLDAERMTHAIALAATSSSGLSKSADTSVAREYHGGQAVMNGINAALAAARGYTAEERILEMSRGFFETFGGADGARAGRVVLDGLGASWDIATDMAIKLVPGGHPFHALAEAAAGAVRDGNITPDEIASIIVSRPGLDALEEPLHPVDLVGMAHSPAYFLAAGAADGDFAWAHASPEKIADPVIHRLIDTVVVGPRPTANLKRYQRGATVTVTTHDGRSSTCTVYAPKGASVLGIDWVDVDAKFAALMPYSGLPAENVAESLELIHALGTLETVERLMALIRG